MALDHGLHHCVLSGLDVVPPKIASHSARAPASIVRRECSLFALSCFCRPSGSFHGLPCVYQDQVLKENDHNALPFTSRGCPSH